MFRIPKEEQSILVFGETQKEGLAPDDLKLLVWNVWKGKRGSPWEKDFQNLRKDRSLILLQEAIADERMSQVFREASAPYEWHMATSFSWRFSQHPTGVITGASAKPKNKKSLRGKERELFFLTPKVSLSTLYALPGHENDLLAINTHVVNFTTTSSFIRFIEELVTLIESHSGPLILAGDFNTWNINRWQSLVAILDRMKLVHVDLGVDPRSLKLDHVFVRGLKIRSAQVKSDIVTSDHFPLSVDLEIS
ncbi:MAG TPA: endonuclease/exonuclease/phosphatase family protein [Pseudobdellovibrionaceae bacterium]|nr:endonuclease/exonuclease/phosphatase family protein [Pseudobdellovibrionaceae bacterium]